MRSFSQRSLVVLPACPRRDAYVHPAAMSAIFAKAVILRPIRLGGSSGGSVPSKSVGGCATVTRPETDQGHQATPPERQMARAADCETHWNLAQDSQKAPFAFASSVPFTTTRQQVGLLQTSHRRIAPARLYCEVRGNLSAPSINGLPGREDHPFATMCGKLA